MENRDIRVSESSIYSWFRENFPDTSVSPHPTDYCTECTRLQKIITSCEVSLSRYGLQPSKNKKEIDKLRLRMNETKEILLLHRGGLYILILLFLFEY